MPPSPSTRIIDSDTSFLSGMKSDLYPGQVPLGYYWCGLNVLNVGGLVSCRPGYRCVYTLPDGNLQGGFIFRPLSGLEQYVVVVDGKVYVANWPFDTFHRLNGLQFNPYAKQIYWVQALQSAARVNDSFTSPITIIPPKAVLFIQDGGDTAPAWYDGYGFGHISGKPNETPIGGDMAWVGDRLWVAQGNQVFASDISNPLSFRESDYLGGQVSFFFRSAVTAMIVTPSTDSPQLMVFTDTNGSLLQANVRDRTQWTTTLNFQEEILGVGCLSARSALSHYGRLVWFSPAGIAFYDPALGGKITSRLPVRDNEMLVSKATMDNDLSGVAVGTYGQFLMVSVPADDRYNLHTWVLNHASLTTLSDDSGPSWAGYWTGTRPVEWACGQVANTERAFYVSYDLDGKNRLWEAFTPDRLDNKCPITWAIFTRGMFGATSSIQEKAPGGRCRLAWVDLAFTGIEEDLNLGVFYAGGTRGAFRQMMNRFIHVQRGCLAYDQQITADSTLYAFKAQSRTVRTEDANQQDSDNEQGSCGVETQDQDNIDCDFQLLIVGHGPATLRWIRPFAFLVPEDLSGSGEACEPENEVRAVRFDGVGTRQETVADAIADLAARPEADFPSQQTVTLEQDGFIAVGVGHGDSIVSQEASDRVATIVATRMAEMELAAALPPVLSTGLDLPPLPIINTVTLIPGEPTLPSNATEGFLTCPKALFAPLPAAAQNFPYSHQLVTGWGNAPFSFSVTAGAFPAGVTMSPTGLVSGTPSAYGTSYATVTLVDSLGQSCSQSIGFSVGISLPSWPDIVWAAPTTIDSQDGNPTIAVASGNTVTYRVDSNSVSHAGYPEPFAGFSGTLNYSGPGSNAEISLVVTDAGNDIFSGVLSSISIAVTQDGVTLLSYSSQNPNNPPVGTLTIPFVVSAGTASPSVITVTVIVNGSKGHFVQTISGSAAITNI